MTKEEWEAAAQRAAAESVGRLNATLSANGNLRLIGEQEPIAFAAFQYNSLLCFHFCAQLQRAGVDISTALNIDVSQMVQGNERSDLTL